MSRIYFEEFRSPSLSEVLRSSPRYKDDPIGWFLDMQKRVEKLNKRVANLGKKQRRSK